MYIPDHTTPHHTTPHHTTPHHTTPHHTTPHHTTPHHTTPHHTTPHHTTPHHTTPHHTTPHHTTPHHTTPHHTTPHHTTPNYSDPQNCNHTPLQNGKENTYMIISTSVSIQSDKIFWQRYDNIISRSRYRWIIFFYTNNKQAWLVYCVISVNKYAWKPYQHLQ